jgi:hypothetical protein
MGRSNLKKRLLGMPFVTAHRVFTGVRPDGFSSRPRPPFPAPEHSGGEGGRAAAQPRRAL